MDFIINMIIILAGAVLFAIFIYRNFSGRISDESSCDCSSCMSQSCSVRQNTTNTQDK